MFQDKFPRTWACMNQGIGAGVAPGFVVGIWQAQVPDLVQLAAIGERRIIPTPQPMSVDTVFDLASLTKIIATAPLTAMLVERRWIGWDTPLSSVLYGYKNRGIELRHLLSHTAGLPSWQPLYEKLTNHFSPTEPSALYRVPIYERQVEMRRLVMDILANGVPDESTVYSDITFLLLGFALEEVTQMPLDRAIRTLLWEPLGLSNTFFAHIDRNIIAGCNDRVAATENSEWRGGILQGQVHDDNAWAMGGYGGHAGAFGTARDILHFVRRLYAGFFTNETLRAMWTRVKRPYACERTLGWDTPSPSSSSVGQYFSSNSVGHFGFTGTSLWIDLNAGFAVTLLSNRVHPSRDNNKIRVFRPKFHDAVCEDLLGVKKCL